MKMQRKDDFTEVSRKSRVKMHKSGKHWVRTVMSQIGLMRIGGKSSASSGEVNLATVKRSMTASQLLRGLAAAGAVVGGNVAVETVMASEVVATSETSTSTLAEADTVVLTTVVDSDSVSVSSSESTSISESASQSESTSVSGSTSISESESLSSSESVSNSESQSASESLSVSESTSVSHSESESESTTTSSSTKSETSTSESAASETGSETSTSESAASDTGSETSASETGATTVEEKQTLEQVISEAEVLVQIASNQSAPSQALLTAIETSRDQILLAHTILGDADATVADLATIISSLQASNQAIGLLLLENDEDGVITFALNTSTTATVTKVGEGYGILVDTLSTASPSMDEANGSAISNPTNNTSFTPSSDAERFTFDYSKFNWFGDQLTDKTVRDNYYFRYSLDYDTTTTTTYIELVNKTTNTVVESHTLDKGETATFTYFQSYAGANNLPLTITYGDSTSSTTTSGELQLQYNGGTLTNTLVPTYQEYTTYYKTTDGKTIATYTINGIGGQMATPSAKRDFAGYDYSSTTGSSTATRLYTPGTVYNNGAIPGNYIKRLAEVVSENGDVIKSVWIKDPTYTGTVDYNSADTTGFIKVMETEVLAPGADNTSLIVPTSFLIDETEAAQIKANAEAGLTGNDAFVVVYEDDAILIRIAFSGSAETNFANAILPQSILKSAHPEYNPTIPARNSKGTTIVLGNGFNTATFNATTHWYTIDTSESESLSNSNSHSLSESESTSNSESTSKSESISNSESLSNSESTSNSESLSNSISESVRESVSESISESVKESVSESISESVKESVSESISESVKESVSESVSESVRE
ncbi:TPA: KxYKxGKxW signal peptide domain-containing protein, partial [Streptococcus suis]